MWVPNTRYNLREGRIPLETSITVNVLFDQNTYFVHWNILHRSRHLYADFSVLFSVVRVGIVVCNIHP